MAGSATVIQWAIWAAAMSLVMGWLARSRQQPPAGHAQGTLVHPRTTLVIGVVCALIFVALALASAIFPGTTGSVWVTLLFLAFASLGALIILEYQRARHTVTPEGIHYGRLFGQGGFLPWKNIQTLHYSASAKWFRLQGPQGVARLSAMLVGLPQFAQLALANVSPQAIDPPTRVVLEQTAAGHLPSIWG